DLLRRVPEHTHPAVRHHHSAIHDNLPWTDMLPAGEVFSVEEGGPLGGLAGHLGCSEKQERDQDQRFVCAHNLILALRWANPRRFAARGDATPLQWSGWDSPLAAS